MTQLWAEIFEGKIHQTVADDAPFVSVWNAKYEGYFPKVAIPDLLPVAMAVPPDPAVETVTGYTVEIVNGLPVQILQTQPVAGNP